MNTNVKSNLKKDAAVQTVLICLWSLLALALAVLIVLEAATALGDNDLTVQEQLTVASYTNSPVGAQNKVYSNILSGRLANRSDKGMTVEAMRVWLRGADGAERVVEVESFVIPARSTYILEKRFDSGNAYEGIARIEVKVNGETSTLVNISAADRSPISVGTVIYAALLVPVVFLLVRSAKKRYYVYQESKLVA